MSDRVLRPSPLSQDSFTEYGDVIETDGRQFKLINDGSARNYSDLASIDVLTKNGHPQISIYESNPLKQPIQIRMLERHPLASQAFVPLGSDPFLVVVATEATPGSVRAFITNGRQGVNFRPNTWHHPLLVLKPESRFLVIDRGGEGDNCEIQDLAEALSLDLQ